jgi:alanyl-tRNA synthetase
VKYLGERFAGGIWKDNYVVFIAANVEGKAALFAKVSPEAIARGVKAVDLIKLAASICGGGGGGRDDFAEAGGKDGSKVGEAAEAVRKRLAELL